MLPPGDPTDGLIGVAPTLVGYPADSGDTPR